MKYHDTIAISSGYLPILVQNAADDLSFENILPAAGYKLTSFESTVDRGIVDRGEKTDNVFGSCPALPCDGGSCETVARPWTCTINTLSTGAAGRITPLRNSLDSSAGRGDPRPFLSKRRYFPKNGLSGELSRLQMLAHPPCASNGSYFKFPERPRRAFCHRAWRRSCNASDDRHRSIRECHLANQVRFDPTALFIFSAVNASPQREALSSGRFSNGH